MLTESQYGPLPVWVVLVGYQKENLLEVCHVLRHTQLVVPLLLSIVNAHEYALSVATESAQDMCVNKHLQTLNIACNVCPPVLCLYHLKC